MSQGDRACAWRSSPGDRRGLGAALCELYRERDWTVLEFSRSAPHPYSVPADLADIRAAAAAFASALPPLAATHCAEVVAIGNAAVLGPVGPVEHASPAGIAAHVDTNVTSAILFARAFVDAFQGHACPKTFVNISSGAAEKGYAGWSPYCASKAAMENFVRSLALEQAAREHPIRAISVNPGVMDTDMQAQVRESSVADFPEVARFLRLQAEGRLAQPSAVADSIAEIVASRPEAGGVYRA